MSTIIIGKITSNITSLVILLVALTPAFMAVVPWDFGSEMTIYRAIMRGYSLTPVIVEIAILILLLSTKFSPLLAISRLSAISNFAWAVLGLLMIFTTIAVAKEVFPAALGAFQLLMICLFSLAIFDWAWRDEGQSARALWSAIGWGIVAYCVILTTAIIVDRPQGDEWVNYLPGLTNVRGMGFFAVPIFFAGTGLFLDTNISLRRSCHIATAILFGSIGIALLLWTGSRGGLMAIFAAVILLVGITKQTKIKLATFSIISGLLGLLGALQLPIENSAYGIDRILGSTVNALANSDYSSGRTDIWLTTIEKIKDRPFLGHGIDQFSTSGPEKTLGYKQPHNFVLQLLFAIGGAGVLLILIFLWSLRGRVKLSVSEPFNLSSLGCIAALSVYSLYDAALYYNYPVMIFIISVAMIIKPIARKPSVDR